MFQRPLRRSLQMKKIIANASLRVLLCTATAYKEADQHIANIEIPSCLPTRMHPVWLKKSQKIFYIKFTQKKLQ